MSKAFFNPFPKYLQIRDILLRRFSHDYALGDRLPAELALAREFGVSRVMVREALRPLEDDGVIRRQQGRGTFLAARPDAGRQQRYTGLVEDFTTLGLKTEAQVLDAGRTLVPPDLTAILKAPADSAIYRIRRLRFLDGLPLAHHLAMLPLDIGAEVAKLNLRRTTLFHEIGKTLGHDITETYQTVDATVADADMASQLQVSIGAPVLVIGRVFAVAGREASLYFESTFRSDRYYYTVQLTHPQRRRHAPSDDDARIIARWEDKHGAAVDAAR